MTYDTEADVMYLFLNDGSDPEIEHSMEIGRETDGLTADLDRSGQVVGLEVQFASERFGAHGPGQVLLELLSSGDRPTN